MRPFLTGMLGLTRYAVGGDSEIRFTLSAGGGVKLFPTRHIGVRLDGRVYTTFVEADVGLLRVLLLLGHAASSASIPTSSGRPKAPRASSSGSDHTRARSRTIRGCQPRGASVRVGVIVAALLIASAGGLAPSQTAAPQELAQEPTFRTGVNLVRVDVTVTGRNGVPLTDLAPRTSTSAKTASRSRFRRSSSSSSPAKPRLATTRRSRFDPTSTPRPRPHATTSGCW